MDFLHAVILLIGPKGNPSHAGDEGHDKNNQKDITPSFPSLHVPSLLFLIIRNMKDFRQPTKTVSRRFRMASVEKWNVIRYNGMTKDVMP
jgi:hypothetical protein